MSALALGWADSLAVISEGRCLIQGTPEEVYLSGNLEGAFGVEVQRVQTQQGWKYYFSAKNPIK